MPSGIAVGMRTLASVLKTARIDAGLTQSEAASQAKLSQSALSRIEAGDRVPGSAALLRLAKVLGLSVDSLPIPPAPKLQRAARRPRRRAA